MAKLLPVPNGFEGTLVPIQYTARLSEFGLTLFLLITVFFDIFLKFRFIYYLIQTVESKYWDKSDIRQHGIYEKRADGSNSTVVILLSLTASLG